MIYCLVFEIRINCTHCTLTAPVKKNKNRYSAEYKEFTYYLTGLSGKYCVKSFIYLCDCGFTPNSRIFYLYVGDQHFDEGKPGSARAKPTTIGMLLENSSTKYSMVM